MTRPVEQLASCLIQWFLQPKAHIYVAFSGGVDSTVLARTAVLAFQRKTLAGIQALYESSYSSPDDGISEVQKIAREIEIPLIIQEAPEINHSLFVQNDMRRCYYCKKLRYQQMYEFIQARHKSDEEFHIVDGSNGDDLLDYRPGYQAICELGIDRPLAELKFTKEEVRSLARYWKLSVAEKPSSPCLATRIAYGISISKERLVMIAGAEHYLHKMGINIVRVRMDTEYTARIEVAKEFFPIIIEEGNRFRIIQYFQELGFKFISLDLEYFQSGHMNCVLPI